MLANAQSTLPTESGKKSEVKASLQQTGDIVEQRQAGWAEFELVPMQQNVELLPSLMLVRSLKAPLKAVHGAISQVKFVRHILRVSRNDQFCKKQNRTEEQTDLFCKRTLSLGPLCNQETIFPFYPPPSPSTHSHPYYHGRIAQPISILRWTFV